MIGLGELRRMDVVDRMCRAIGLAEDRGRVPVRFEASLAVVRGLLAEMRASNDRLVPVADGELKMFGVPVFVRGDGFLGEFHLRTRARVSQPAFRFGPERPGYSSGVANER